MKVVQFVQVLRDLRIKWDMSKTVGHDLAAMGDQKTSASANQVPTSHLPCGRQGPQLCKGSTFEVGSQFPDLRMNASWLLLHALGT